MGDLDVCVLVLLCSAANQDNELIAMFSEIDSITGAEINSTFKDAGTDSLRVRKFTLLDQNQRGCNLCRCRCVESAEPLRKWAVTIRIKVLPDRDHDEW